MEPTKSVTQTNNTVDAARDYVNRGWAVVPVNPGDKQCYLKDWPDLRIKPEQVGEFFDERSSVGVLTGDASSGLTDVEADCDEAVYAASRLLPETLRMGRGSVTGHYFYGSPGSRSYKFKDVDGSVMLEIRSTGAQTVVPPSSHESGYQRVFRNPDTEPLEIAPHELRSYAARVAVSALVARHLPESGRHDLALAYAGLMLKPLMDLGEDKDDATEYVWGVLRPAWEYQGAGEEALTDLYACITGTADKIEAGEPATGGKTVGDLLVDGAAIVKRIKDGLGWGDLTPEQREALEQRQRVKRADKAIADPNVSKLAHNPDLLNALLDRVRESGLLGETENAKLLLLAAVSLVRGKPISAIVKGTSAVGKSEIIKAVTRALPPEMVVERQSMSSQSLVYMGENGQLKNKVLVVYELGGFGTEGSEGLEQAKQLLSEGRISRQTVDRDETNRNTGRAIVTEGPTAMWTTTTRVKTDYELSTRVFELTPDDGQDQTGAINEKAFDYDGDEAETDFADSHGVFTWLLGRDNRVYFPHGKTLGKLIPKSAVKMRRESQRIRLLIDAHATLHQANRERDERGRIVATPDDYEAIRGLMEPFVGTASEQGVKEQVRTTVEKAAEIVAGKDETDDKSFTVKELQTALKKDNGSTNRRIRAAYPYIVELDDKRGRSKLYGMGEELPASRNVLPTVDELCKSATQSSPEGESGSGTENVAEKSAEFGADFAQSSANSRGVDTQEPPFNGENTGEETHEKPSPTRGSIGVQSCRVRGEQPENGPNPVQSSSNSATGSAELGPAELRAIVRDHIRRYPAAPYASIWSRAGLSHARADWDTFVSLVLEERKPAA